MDIVVVRTVIRANWSQSLKDKRSEAKKLAERLKNRFNAAVAQTDKLDDHKIIVIETAMFAPDRARGDAMAERAAQFVEDNTDGEVTEVSWEYR